MLNSGEKKLRFARQKNNSNPCVVRKKISERNKKPYLPPCKLNGRSLSRFGYFVLSYFCYIIDVVYWSCVIALH